MRISLVVLDLDGTIVRLQIDYDSLRKELHNLFLEYGIDADFRSLYPVIEESCDTIKIRISEKESKKAFKSAMGAIEKFEVENIEKTEIMEDADFFIKKIKEKGKKLAIFSSNTRKCVEGALNKFDLLNYFDFIVTRNDVRGIKPKIEGLEIISRKLFSNPNEMVLIGDTTHDIESAKKFGSKSIGVLTGSWSESNFRNSGADKIVSNLIECLDVID